MHRLGVDGAVAVVTFVVATGVYGATLLRGVSSADPAEMQTVPTVLGIAHPTTYPLWTLLGFLWTRLPFASAALLMNALSAVLFAASAAGAAALARRLGARPIFAVGVTGLTFAFAGLTWSRATQADVHALHTLLLVLELLAWETAERSGSRNAALVLVGLVGLGLAHHRLMLITGVPLAVWFFVRHVAWLRSPTFVVRAVVIGAAPLLLYLYLPLRGDGGAPVVNADSSEGWLSAASAFSGNQKVWSGTSLGNWLAALPHDVALASDWIGFIPVALALVGGYVLVRTRPAIAAGLAWTLLAPTYGAANRELDDVHHRWLIVPLLVVTVLASVGAEALARVVLRVVKHRARDVSNAARAVTALVIVAAVAMPISAFARGHDRYDRSADTRDERNAARIMRALKPDAVVWAYWDVRTMLQYERFAENVRNDVEILDHRAYARYRTGDDSAVALAVARDPRYARRPLYVLPGITDEPGAVARLETQFDLRPILTVGEPSEAVTYHGGGHLYLVERPSPSLDLAAARFSVRWLRRPFGRSPEEVVRPVGCPCRRSRPDSDGTSAAEPEPRRSSTSRPTVRK
jgi:hypothetical protein